MLSERKPYKSDLDDETYLFILPYFLLAPEDAHQRVYPIREVLNAALWIGRTGVSGSTSHTTFRHTKLSISN